MVKGATPRGGEVPASEGDPRVRGQGGKGNGPFVAMANLQTAQERVVTPPGRSRVTLTQPGAIPETTGDIG